MRSGKGDVAAGEVLLIPFQNGYIVSQVGFGLDLAVFSKSLNNPSDTIPADEQMLFRVQFSRPSAKENKWLSLGVRELLDPSLAEAATYSHFEIGSDCCYLIREGEDDIEVAREIAEKHEQLATWSHQHIIERFAKIAASEGAET